MKEEFLRRRFEEEKKFLPARISASKLLHHKDKPPIFEIANEPNLFPYVPPDLYALYYTWWAREIKKLAPDAKIMPGGLWVHEVIPKKINKLLPLIGVEITDTKKYYGEFLDHIPNERLSYRNLHIYPYGNVDFEEITVSSCFPVWVTEFGNINPYNEKETLIFVKDLHKKLEKAGVERAYYFQARYSERNFQLFHHLNREYKKSGIFNRIIGLLGFVFRRKTSLIYMLAQYIKHPPIQNLEGETGLNLIGKYFKTLEK